MRPSCNGLFSPSDDVDINACIEEKMSKNGDVWQCLDCLWTTKNRTRLWEHIEAKHVQSPGYTCQLCYKFCPSKRGLINHKARNHRGAANLDFSIQFYSLDFDDLVKSKTWKDEEGNIRCSDCDYSSKFLTNVKNHIEAHHVQGLNQGYSCTFCSKVFKSKNSFQTHKSRFKGKCSQHVFQIHSNL